MVRGHANVVCDGVFQKGIQSDGIGPTNEAFVLWVSWPYTKEIYVMDLRILKKGWALEKDTDSN